MNRTTLYDDGVELNIYTYLYIGDIWYVHVFYNITYTICFRNILAWFLLREIEIDIWIQIYRFQLEGKYMIEVVHSDIYYV